MEIKISTLSENSATHDCIAEWGLSMYIEADGQKILFDTGMGTAAVHNARLMGIDFSNVDRIVLSHAHHDHTGGLREILKIMRREVEIIAHPDVWSPKYGRHGKSPPHFSGIHYRRELLENLGARFNLTREPFRISDNFLTTGEILMVTDYEEVDRNLFDFTSGEMLPDELRDDLAMILDTEFGLVVILGCAHRGIINTLRHACRITGKELVYAAIGGTHLISASDDRLQKTAAELQEIGVQYLGVSHCTGFKASSYLSQEFGERFFLNNSGTRLTLPF